MRTIRARLTAAIAVLMLVIGALSAVAYVGAERTHDLVHQPAIRFAGDQDLAELAILVPRMLRVHDRDGDQLQVAMGAATAAMARVEAAAQRSGDPEDRRLAADLRMVLDAIVAQQRRALDLIAAGDEEAANAVILAVFERLYAEHFRGLLSKARERVSGVALHSLQTVERDARARSRVALAITAGSVLLMFAVWLTVRRVLRRLTATADVVTRMGQGDLDARAPDVTTADELGDLGRAVNGMAANLHEMMGQCGRQLLVVKEMALASRVQKAMLPPAPALPGLDIHGEMTTATEVGGDYYDVIPSADGGGWIAIGDVSGHGVNAGIVMVMAQAALAAAVRADASAGPAAILATVNHVLFENIRCRIGRREHMTLTLLRYHPCGRIVHAGAHVELLVRRAAGEVEPIATPGVWMGMMPDACRHLVEREVYLAPGDTLVLHTDGLTDAIGRDGTMYGLDRLGDAVRRAPDGAAALCDDVLANVRAEVDVFDDDATLLVVHRRRLAVAAATAADAAAAAAA